VVDIFWVWNPSTDEGHVAPYAPFCSDYVVDALVPANAGPYGPALSLHR